MYDYRNKIVGLAETALVKFLEMRLNDLGIEAQWRAGLWAFVKDQYENQGRKANYKLVYIFLQNHNATELKFETLDITALTALIHFYPKSQGIYKLSPDSEQLFINQIKDIQEVRNINIHKPQQLTPEEKAVMHMFQLWAITRIEGLALLVMRYKGPIEEWKQIYQRAKEIDNELQGERWLALEDFKNPVIPPDTDLSDILFLAEHGNAEAELLAGKAYYHGSRVKQDPEKAYGWIRKAAKYGDLPEAEYYLGMCYYYGDGTDRDDKKALQWIKRSADHGFAQAQYQYANELFGQSFSSNNRSPEKEREAFHFASLSAQQGCKDGFRLLIHFYDLGVGVQKDYQKAHELIVQAAEQGQGFAMCMLASQAKNEKKYDEAIKWYSLAAEKGENVSSEIKQVERKKQIEQRKKAKEQR